MADTSRAALRQGRVRSTSWPAAIRWSQHAAPSVRSTGPVAGRPSTDMVTPPWERATNTGDAKTITG